MMGVGAFVLRKEGADLIANTIVDGDCFLPLLVLTRRWRSTGKNRCW